VANLVNAEIVAIGSELLLGQIVDTNSAWIAKKLTEIGVDLYFKTVVGDNPDRMKEVLHRALCRADVVITSGGLGPTKDDITREVVSAVTKRKLVTDQNLIDQMKTRFQKRGLVMTKNNERQALIPNGATIVSNPNGTAPSFIVDDGSISIFCLPGVPFELKWLFKNEVVPYLRERFNLSEVITYKVLKVAGMGESNVDELIGHFMETSKNPTVGVLAHPGQVDIRITAKSSSYDDALKLISPLEKSIRSILKEHIFGVDDQTLESTVGELLLSYNKTVSCYEDVTGGLLSEKLMKANPERFIQGMVCGGEKSIRQLTGKFTTMSYDLNKPESLVKLLASAIRLESGSDYGLAIHGIPDESDRAENLAKGQTHICITDGKNTTSRTYNMSGRGTPDRIRISFNAMDLLRSVLVG
jgi:nicotinamide-nucleotide amidase